MCNELDNSLFESLVGVTAPNEHVCQVISRNIWLFDKWIRNIRGNRKDNVANHAFITSYECDTALCDQEMPISSAEEEGGSNVESRMDLDSYVNMVVIGRSVTILRKTRQHAEVAPFVPDYESLYCVLIVDMCSA